MDFSSGLVTHTSATQGRLMNCNNLLIFVYFTCSVCVCLCVCVCMRIYVHLCMHMYVRTYMCVYNIMYVRMISIQESTYVRTCVYIYYPCMCAKLTMDCISVIKDYKIVCHAHLPDRAASPLPTDHKRCRRPVLGSAGGDYPPQRSSR